MTNREIMEGAIEAIEKYGWTQGKRGEKDKPCCISGALSEAVGAGYLPNTNKLRAYPASRSDVGYTDWTKALTTLGMLGEWGVWPGNLHTWNDKVGRTKEEVIQRLREAAEVPDGR